MQNLHIECLANQKLSSKIEKIRKDSWTSKTFGETSPYCSTYFEIRNPVPRQSTSFLYTFSCHFEAFIYVFTHKIRERHKEKYFVIPSLIMMEVSR